MTPAQHLTRYPGCRSSTLIHLIQKEKMTERLRKEVEARKPWYARIIARAFVARWR